jgi:hypothetical protein
VNGRSLGWVAVSSGNIVLVGAAVLVGVIRGSYVDVKEEAEEEGLLGGKANGRECGVGNGTARV